MEHVCLNPCSCLSLLLSALSYTLVSAEWTCPVSCSTPYVANETQNSETLIKIKKMWKTASSIWQVKIFCLLCVVCPDNANVLKSKQKLWMLWNRNICTKDKDCSKLFQNCLKSEQNKTERHFKCMTISCLQ